MPTCTSHAENPYSAWSVANHPLDTTHNEMKLQFSGATHHSCVHRIPKIAAAGKHHCSLKDEVGLKSKLLEADFQEPIQSKFKGDLLLSHKLFGQLKFCVRSVTTICEEKCISHNLLAKQSRRGCVERSTLIFGQQSWPWGGGRGNDEQICEQVLDLKSHWDQNSGWNVRVFFLPYSQKFTDHHT